MKGRISISKVHVCGMHSTEEDYVKIELKDKSSSIEFITVDISLKDFTEALFGLSGVPIEFELRGTENIGKKLETRTLQVFIPNHDSTNTDEKERVIDSAVKKFETEGWHGRKSDCRNFHNRIKSNEFGEVYNVYFWRWV